jgi:predicted transcriptional regulator
MSAKNNSKQLKNMGAFANKRVGKHTWIMFPGVMKTLMAMATPVPKMPARISKRGKRNPQYYLYPSKIAIISETTYSHSVLTLQKFEEEGIIRREKIGRITTFTLTKKGEELIRWFREFMTLLELPKNGLTLKQV